MVMLQFNDSSILERKLTKVSHLQIEKTQYNYYRWVIQSILFFIQIGLGLNFMAPSPLFLSIMENYEINKGIVGLLISSVTFVMALFLLPGGFLISKIGSKNSMIVSGSLMSAGLLLPFINSFVMVVLLRILFGIGAAISIPTTSAITMEWFKPKELSIINGINESGRALGFSLGILLANPIANGVGWSMTLVFYSMVPAFATLFWVIGGRTSKTKINETQTSIQEILPFIFNRNVLLLAIGTIGPLTFFVGVTSWFPTYYNEFKDMTLAEAGSIVSILPLVNAVFNPISGVILSKFNSRKLLLIASGLVLPMFAFGSIFAASEIILIICFAGIGIFMSLFIVSIITIPMELPNVTASKVGIVTAVILTTGNFASVISPIFIGTFTDYTGSYIPALVIIALMPITLFIPGLFLRTSNSKNV